MSHVELKAKGTATFNNIKEIRSTGLKRMKSVIIEKKSKGLSINELLTLYSLLTVLYKVTGLKKSSSFERKLENKRFLDQFFEFYIYLHNVNVLFRSRNLIFLDFLESEFIFEKKIFSMKGFYCLFFSSSIKVCTAQSYSCTGK